MGYNLYITRKRIWSDDGIGIPFEEWEAFVKSDPKLSFAADEPQTVVFTESTSDWLTWSRGNLYTKNPSNEVINEMVRIGISLNARVLGEDGETYKGNGDVVPPATHGLLRRMRRWWNDRPLSKPRDIEIVENPFRVGDRVKDIFGDQRVGTVRSVDAKAMHGLGVIVVDYDNGHTGRSCCIGHGLEALDEGRSEAFDVSKQSHHPNEN